MKAHATSAFRLINGARCVGLTRRVMALTHLGMPRRLTGIGRGRPRDGAVRASVTGMAMPSKGRQLTGVRTCGDSLRRSQLS